MTILIKDAIEGKKFPVKEYYKLPDESPALEELSTQGVVEKIGGQLKITPQGRFQLNQLWGDSAPQYRWGGF